MDIYLSDISTGTMGKNEVTLFEILPLFFNSLLLEPRNNFNLRQCY